MSRENQDKTTNVIGRTTDIEMEEIRGNIRRFGLQKGFDEEVISRTKEWKTKEWDQLIADLDKQSTKEFIDKILLWEASLKEEQKIAFLRKSEKDREEHRTSAQAIELQQINLKSIQDAAPKVKIEKPVESLKSVSAYEAELDNLKKEMETSEKEYKVQKEGIVEASDFIGECKKNKLDLKTELGNKILELESTHPERWERINFLLRDKKTEKEGRKLLAELNSEIPKIACLKDMFAVVNKDKVMYKLDGTITDNFDEGAFIVPRIKNYL